MPWYGIALIITACIVALFLLATYVCFYITFYVSERRRKQDKEFDIPPGKIYEPYRDTMISWMQQMRNTPHRCVSITSFDGLKLCGKYYEFEPGAAIELMFHGYRGRQNVICAVVCNVVLHWDAMR